MEDLSRNDGEQSAYGYCLGNPIRNVDPTGYFAWSSVGNFFKKIGSSFKWFGRAVYYKVLSPIGRFFRDTVNPFSKKNPLYQSGYRGDTLSKVITYTNPLSPVVESA
jgi:hypothetical protein